MNKCAYCSFNELEHNRAMLLSHPMMRHAFVEAGFDKIAEPAKMQLPDLKDSYLITPESFERITPTADYQFRGLGQIYGEDDIKRPFSAIGVLASRKKSNENKLEKMREIYQEKVYRETGDEAKATDTDAYWTSKLYGTKYKEVQEGVSKHIKPELLLKHKDTGHLFEVYSHPQGLLFVRRGANSRGDELDRVFDISTTTQGNFLSPAREVENVNDFGAKLTGASPVTPHLHSILTANGFYDTEKAEKTKVELEEEQDQSRSDAIDRIEEAEVTKKTRTPNNPGGWTTKKLDALFRQRRLDDEAQLAEEIASGLRSQRGVALDPDLKRDDFERVRTPQREFEEKNREREVAKTRLKQLKEITPKKKRVKSPQQTDGMESPKAEPKVDRSLAIDKWLKAKPGAGASEAQIEKWQKSKPEGIKYKKLKTRVPEFLRPTPTPVPATEESPATEEAPKVEEKSEAKTPVKKTPKKK